MYRIGGTKLHGFVDATFSIEPDPISQSLVVMLYFSKYDLYGSAYRSYLLKYNITTKSCEDEWSTTKKMASTNL